MLTGLLFASPWILGLLLFNAYPIGSSFYYSLTSFSVLTRPVWVGFDNYVKLVTQDHGFRHFGVELPRLRRDAHPQRG